MPTIDQFWDELVDEGLLEPDQAGRARARHAQAGGGLDTAVLETRPLNSAEQSRLIGVASRILGYPICPVSYLQDPDPSAVMTQPSHLLAKYGMLPARLVKGRPTIVLPPFAPHVMSNALARIPGSIEVFIALEFELREALEKHANQPLPPRFIALRAGHLPGMMSLGEMPILDSKAPSPITAEGTGAPPPVNPVRAGRLATAIDIPDTSNDSDTVENTDSAGISGVINPRAETLLQTDAAPRDTMRDMEVAVEQEVPTLVEFGLDPEDVAEFEAELDSTPTRPNRIDAFAPTGELANAAKELKRLQGQKNPSDVGGADTDEMEKAGLGGPIKGGTTPMSLVFEAPDRVKPSLTPVPAAEESRDRRPGPTTQGPPKPIVARARAVRQRVTTESLMGPGAANPFTQAFLEGDLEDDDGVQDELGWSMGNPVPPAGPAIDPVTLKAALTRLEEGNPIAQNSARAELLAAGEAGLAALCNVFPGRLSVDRYAPDALARAVGDHGPVLAAILRFGDACAPQLEKLCDHLSPDIRFYAVFMYTALTLPPPANTLTDRLLDADPGVREVAARVAEQHRDTTEFALIASRLDEVLGGQDPRALRAAAEAVGRLRIRLNPARLCDLLDAAQPPVQSAAHRALVQLTARDLGTHASRWRSWLEHNATRPHIEWLLDGLENPDLNIRTDAYEELRRRTRATYDFDPKADEAKRALAVDRWRGWWQRESERER